MMIGKTVFEEYTPKEGECKDAILQVKNLSNHKLNDISFDVHEGEIVGFYGLVGAGKTELARAIYGVDDYEGEILFKGRKLPPSPDKAIEAGIALVPEERRSQGLFTILTIRGNVPVMNMKKISRNGFINAQQERKVTLEYIDKLRIATSSTEKEASKLSGGNQQKVVFAKCLFADADLLMLDEPTRGIDVGAKSEIYGIIRRLSSEGKSIMIFSSELPEIMNICDSIYLLYDGSLKATMRNGCDIDSEKIIHIVTGGENETWNTKTSVRKNTFIGRHEQRVVHQPFHGRRSRRPVRRCLRIRAELLSAPEHDQPHHEQLVHHHPGDRGHLPADHGQLRHVGRRHHRPDGGPLRLFLPGRQRLPERAGQRPGLALRRRRRAGPAVRHGHRGDQCVLHRTAEGALHHHHARHDDARARASPRSSRGVRSGTPACPTCSASWETCPSKARPSSSPCWS